MVKSNKKINLGNHSDDYFYSKILEKILWMGKLHLGRTKKRSNKTF